MKIDQLNKSFPKMYNMAIFGEVKILEYGDWGPNL